MFTRVGGYESSIQSSSSSCSGGDGNLVVGGAGTAVTDGVTVCAGAEVGVVVLNKDEYVDVDGVVILGLGLPKTGCGYAVPGVSGSSGGRGVGVVAGLVTGLRRRGIATVIGRSAAVGVDVPSVAPVLVGENDVDSVSPVMLIAGLWLR